MHGTRTHAGVSIELIKRDASGDREAIDLPCIAWLGDRFVVGGQCLRENHGRRMIVKIISTLCPHILRGQHRILWLLLETRIIEEKRHCAIHADDRLPTLMNDV